MEQLSDQEPATHEEPQQTTLAELREFIDPMSLHEHETDETLLEVFAASRAPVNLPGVGQINGYEAILAESQHALIRVQGELPIPISTDRREEIIAATQVHASIVAGAVFEVASQLEDSFGKEPLYLQDGGMITTPAHLVLSGKTGAAVAYDQLKRRSGRAFFVHPDEAASILTIAWRHQGLSVLTPYIDPNEQTKELDLLRFLIYWHDAFEDTIDRKDLSKPDKKALPSEYLNDPVIMTPLVAKYVLEKEGIQHPHDEARTLLALTRTRDTEGNRMPYNEVYIPRGIRIAGRRFVFTKAPDLQHNRSIEPDRIAPDDAKSQKKLEKRMQYERAVRQVKIAAEDYPLDLGTVIHRIFQVTRSEVEAEDRRKHKIRVADTAQRVRSIVASRLNL